MKRTILSFALLMLGALLFAGCATDTSNTNSNTTATTNVSPPAGSPSPATQQITVVAQPENISKQKTDRGEVEKDTPTLRFLMPTDGTTVTGSTVRVKLALKSEKGYKTGKDPATGTGNHIHVILDNEPYEAYYNLDQPFELRNVSEGKHTLRVFASRPWHESYKNAGSFQMVTFTVKGGGDPTKPTTTNSGQVMSNANKNANVAANPTPSPEGKDVNKATQAGAVDPKKPLLTYSRPKGDNKISEPLMIDFWLANATLGTDYRVRYSIDGGAPQYLDKWEPIWLTGWTLGKHTVKLELVDKDNNVVQNGDYNSTTREINIIQ